MRPYQILMAVALAWCAGLVLFGDNTPSAGIAEPVTRTSAAPVQAPARAQPLLVAAADTAILRLAPRVELVGEAGDAVFAAGEGVFQVQNWNPPPPPPLAPPPPSNEPPPAPVAPPVPFTYIGKAVADGAWEVYLARGDQTYVVRAQTVIDATYRVDRIAPPLLSMTYLPLNLQQQITIGVLE